jgi:hypothetical protein
MKQGLSDVLLLWLHVLSIFQQSYPNSTYEAGIEWCAALCDFYMS